MGDPGEKRKPEEAHAVIQAACVPSLPLGPKSHNGRLGKLPSRRVRTIDVVCLMTQAALLLLLPCQLAPLDPLRSGVGFLA